MRGSGMRIPFDLMALGVELWDGDASEDSLGNDPRSCLGTLDIRFRSMLRTQRGTPTHVTERPVTHTIVDARAHEARVPPKLCLINPNMGNVQLSRGKAPLCMESYIG